jgi:hypothetical protein
MDALTARCPACVIALQRPEDGNEVSTITLLEGNRATNLGLATLLQTMAKKKLVEAATPTVDDQPDDLSGQDQDDDDASEPG